MKTKDLLVGGVLGFMGKVIFNNVIKDAFILADNKNMEKYNRMVRGEEKHPFVIRDTYQFYFKSATELAAFLKYLMDILASKDFVDVNDIYEMLTTEEARRYSICQTIDARFKTIDRFTPKYGWTDLTGADIVKWSWPKGYVLTLPNPEAKVVE